ncbi:hypothetical protein [uncultured Traorella sp.]|uniref:hypothetical protein n=1 Tax=uncultured Traorella sp. TaxID=1929048 RepID=UPI0025ED9EE7|nr:hypothetical protein [uncultured Traorella sp.]
MKLILLIIFLILSLVLPLVVAFEHKRRGMIMAMALGVLIYVLSTALTNFTAQAIGLESLNLAEDRETYVVMVTLSLTIVIVLFSLSKKIFGDEHRANLIYSGFSLVNTFLYNMNAYSFLVFVAIHNSAEKLSAYYPMETVNELLNYYQEISSSDILLLIIEMICSFFIMKSLFCMLCRNKVQIADYLIFIVGIFIFFYSQYCIQNKVLVFGIYIVLLFAGYRNKLSFKKDS